MACILESWVEVWVSLLVLPKAEVCPLMGCTLVSPGMRKKKCGGGEGAGGVVGSARRGSW